MFAKVIIAIHVILILSSKSLSMDLHSFRVEWGSAELGEVIHQDLIVFSTDTLSIIRPKERNKNQLLFCHGNENERLYWALVDNYTNGSDRISVSCYGEIPPNKDYYLNIKELLEMQCHVNIIDSCTGRKYEFYKIKGNRIDDLFYHNSQTAESNPLSSGEYILVVSEISQRRPLFVKTFVINDHQIKKANSNFLSNDKSPERFCGIININLMMMKDASIEVKQMLDQRIPKTSVLSGALHMYYRKFHSFPRYSFRYSETQ